MPAEMTITVKEFINDEEQQNDIYRVNEAERSDSDNDNNISVASIYDDAEEIVQIAG